ncbi:MAG: phosphorylase [Gammaproteobacteria bacterium]|nr:phosphorylase [Gammaproteobacteria bacterium]MCP5458099.1 phosphorylase [Gammaproteobacteria bacterium]
MLWSRTKQCTTQALECGALLSLPTESEIVRQDGIDFLVRKLANLARKEARQRSVPRLDNPFLPYEQDLYVGDVSDTHVCLLNKFNVVDHHLLVVTRAFEEQESPLNQRDFEALGYGLSEYACLVFYNAGQAAGASQRHKHLQIVPLPLASQAPRIPLEARLLEDARRGRYSLPFEYRFVRFPSGDSAPEIAAKAFGCYRNLLRELDLFRDSESVTDPSLARTHPYNLLITRDWLLMVPRVRENAAEIPVNALGYAGTMLVKNANQLEILKQTGPLSLLGQVARPIA